MKKISGDNNKTHEKTSVSANDKEPCAVIKVNKGGGVLREIPLAALKNMGFELLLAKEMNGYS